MSEERPRLDFGDRTHININDQYEVEYWTGQLGVSTQRLRKAATEVGANLAKIRRQLEK